MITLTFEDVNEFQAAFEETYNNYNKEHLYDCQIKLANAEAALKVLEAERDEKLDIHEYETVGVTISLTNESWMYSNLNNIGLKFNSIPGSGYCYNLSIQELEIVYNKLCELAALPFNKSVVNNKEKPCKCCGRMNDIGAKICWGFTCGVSLE